MIVWIEILGQPRRQLYRNADAVPYLDLGAARHALVDSFDTLRSSVDGQVANIRINLRNDAGQASRLFAADPPVAYEAVVWQLAQGEPVERFRGVVESLSLAAQAVMELRA